MSEPRIAPGSGWNDDTRLLARGHIRLDGLRIPRRLSAYHEAAHAVVARTLGCTVAHVDIMPETVRGGACIHVTPDAYRVPSSRRIRGTSILRETTRQEREAMALRQRDASIATTALAGVALEDIARAVPALDLLPAGETLNGTTLEGQRLRSRSDILKAAEAARRQHRTDAGRDQFFRRARARAARIMLANWPSLTAVAEALFEHTALDGQEVDRLMQRATLRRSNRPG
jgi:ATP-dependent Zn protease